MALGQGRIAAHQPLATDGEAGVEAAFFNAGALQQWQCSSASTKEDEGADHLIAAIPALQLQQPAGAIRQPLEIAQFAAAAQLQGATALQRLQVGAGEAAEIHIGAAADAGGGHGLRCSTPLHHQRHPISQLSLVLAPLHACKGRHGAELLLALAQKRHISAALHPADMGHLMKKGGCIKTSLLVQGGPELKAALKAGIDAQSLGSGHRAIGLLWGVVELAVGGMARAGVIDGRAALERRLIEALEHQQAQLRIQRVQKHRQGGAHDSAAHQHGVVALQNGQG